MHSAWWTLAATSCTVPRSMADRVSPSSWHPNHLCNTHVSVIVLVRAVHTFKYILTSVTQCVRISKLSASKPSALVPLSRCLDPYPLRPQIMEFRKKTSKVFIFSKIILFELFGVLLLYVTIQGSNLSASVITSAAGLRLLPTVNQNVALQRALM